MTDVSIRIDGKYWVTRDGDILKISEMSTKHLLGAFEKIVREQWRVIMLQPLEEELFKRGYALQVRFIYYKHGWSLEIQKLAIKESATRVAQIIELDKNNYYN